jgi:spore coat protein A
MKIHRRAFLADGAKVAAAFALGPMLLRMPSCRARAITGALTKRSAEPLCSSRVRGAVAPEAIRQPLHPENLARFVDPLPIPRVLVPTGTRPHPVDPSISVPVLRVTMRPTEVRVHRDLPPTRMWGFEGEVPGPTIAVMRGRPLFVEWASELPERHFLPIDHTLHGAHDKEPEVRTVVHVHGAKAPPEADGYPESWFLPGHSVTAFYPNEQDAATLWYHDHAMGIERLNQYAGLFGFFLIRDPEGADEALGLPSRRHEIPLVLCDRLLDAEGQLIYPTSGVAGTPWVPEIYGDAHLVNGKIAPFVEVEPRRTRLRIVNASNARFYLLSLTGQHPFVQIGTDQGLLPTPITLEQRMMAPGERVDLIVDFSAFAGQNLYLQSQTLKLLQFRVAAAKVAQPVREAPLAAKLRSVPRLEPGTAVRTRTLTLKEYVDPKTRGMIMLLNGMRWQAPVTEKPVLDTVEIWELVNLTQDSHPIHLHLVRFQLLNRQGYDFTAYDKSRQIVPRGAPVPPAPEDIGWKDTIRADASMVTRIIVHFSGFPGRYVWHCHVLEHAANEMMRPFEVVAAG